MKNLFKISIISLALCISARAATSSGAANDTTTTTWSAAVSATTNYVCLASGTGVVLPSLPTGVQGSLLVSESEVLQVMANPTGSCYIVKRGQNGSPQVAHNSGVGVWVGNPATSSGDSSRPFTGGPFIITVPTGSCVPANQYTLPLIRIPDQYGYNNTGAAYTCFAASSTATGVWGLLGGTYYAGTVASVAGAQWLAGMSMSISGTNAITGFTIPNGFPSGACIVIYPTAAFTTTTAGNIAAATTAVANKTLFECWNGSKLVPSY